MKDHDGITSDVRSREEEYFRRKDRELVEKMRLAAAAQEARQELEARSGIHDPAVLQELEALGFTPDTVSLLPLVPIVQVAWAEGGVSAEERQLIEQFARERGIEPGGPAANKLASWLEIQPSEEVFARATHLIRAMLDDPAGPQKDLRIEDLIHRCESIAAASGGLLGFRKISAEERSLLQQIEAALTAR
jgi:tellurite resistance protein